MSACEAVREILVDAARGAPVENSLREHLENCPACRRRLANERMLSAGLAAISSENVPPASVRNAVTSEFRRVNRVVPIRRPLVQWIAMAAAAAAMLLAIFFSAMRGPKNTIAKTIATVPPRVEAPLPVHAQVLAAPVVAARAPMPVLATRRRAVKVQPRPSESAPPPLVDPVPEVATDFFEIPYAEPLRPEERVDVFRMQMPRANLAVFGLPVNGGRLDSRVTADVLMGEDGVVRAVRFIR